MKEGDRNTWFFHRMTNSPRRGNQILMMRINGEWVTKDFELRQGIVEAFKSVLTNTGEWRASLDDLSFPKIEAPRLELPFTEEEVFIALSDLNGDKVPGPNGFTIALWQFSWDIVKVDVIRMFTDFLETSKFVKNLNTTFLVMVLKKEGSSTLRTIGLLA